MGFHQLLEEDAHEDGHKRSGCHEQRRVPHRKRRLRLLIKTQSAVCVHRPQSAPAQCYRALLQDAQKGVQRTEVQ